MRIPYHSPGDSPACVLPWRRESPGERTVEQILVAHKERHPGTRPGQPQISQIGTAASTLPSWISLGRETSGLESAAITKQSTPRGDFSFSRDLATADRESRRNRCLSSTTDVGVRLIFRLRADAFQAIILDSEGGQKGNRGEIGNGLSLDQQLLKESPKAPRRANHSNHRSIKPSINRSCDFRKQQRIPHGPRIREDPNVGQAGNPGQGHRLLARKGLFSPSSGLFMLFSPNISPVSAEGL